MSLHRGLLHNETYIYIYIPFRWPQPISIASLEMLQNIFVRESVWNCYLFRKFLHIIFMYIKNSKKYIFIFPMIKSHRKITDKLTKLHIWVALLTKIELMSVS